MQHHKLITWLSAAILGISAATAFPAGMTAEASTGTQTVNGIYYSYDTATHKAKVTGCANNLTEANIVSSFRVDGTTDTVTVTEIDTGAFKNKWWVTSVSIPGSIKVIGSDAFWRSGITSVSIPNGVKVINENTFRESKLTSVSIPNSVVLIGDRAFLESPLAAVTIPSSVRTIGDFAFSETALQTVTVPATVEDLTRGAFFYCQSLTSATIQGATRIGSITFQGCTALENVSLSSAVPEIGGAAFSGCSALQTVTIPGATELNENVFQSCAALSSVWLSDSAWVSSQCYTSVFNDCPALYTLNDAQVLQYETDDNGIQKPILNPVLKTVILKYFRGSKKVGFVDSYCTELCNYIVKTETSYDPDGPDQQPNDWMNDALKARQLHDWLVRHCKREDGLDQNGQQTESNGDDDNQIASSVFLSYATDNRGEGVGESICAGLSKAYTMLLATAHIESYYVRNSYHASNLVRIGDRYYHVDMLSDVNWYEFTTPNPYKTCYRAFLKKINSPSSIYQENHDEHPLLTIYQNDISGEICNCTEDYFDNNGDGLLDYDLDLDGNYFQGSDWQAYNGVYNGLMQFSFGFCGWETINDRMPEVFSYLHQHHEDYWTYVNNSAPKDTTELYGKLARFEVNLFGDDLTYQWMYYDTTTGAWRNLTVQSAQDAILEIPATRTTDRMKFACVVRNKENIYIYSNIVTLTVRYQ